MNNVGSIPVTSKSTTFLSLALFLILSSPAGAQIIVGDSVSPGITYVDIPDTSLPFVVKDYTRVDIDIDMDGIKDIRFLRSHESSPGYYCEQYAVYSLNTIQYVVLDSATNDIDSLSPGTLLDNSAHWNNNFNGGYFYYYFYSIPPPPFGDPPYHHGVCTTPDTYIGFRKIYYKDTLYGWFNLDLIDPYILKRFAVDKLFNSWNIKDDGSLPDDFIIYPNPVADQITIKCANRSNIEFSLILRNILGQKLFSENVNLSRFSIYMGGYNEGIYFLEIQQDKLRIVKKIIVQR